ncbi:hypothetical protein JY651_19660 [Pyxidicoccus parkwayensis]|uniref:RING-type domain-containing protein n=1 Tax=Pyxidicoccus parkwayensis TaxID=2813578 RepID=A0ABX7P900_9BACT|nr:hypothetical protein [Pyxidicoccus parkwaysis]QSQ26994.1 hypothetical protein JY651_19660 [Pyxidicoccus parkwaysis]
MDESLLPDILDQVGRQPREFGAVQLHVDPVVRAPEGTRATASIWLQGAFTPMAPGASLRVLDAATRREVLHARLPSLERGQVLRWTLPLSLDAEVRELLFQPVAPVPEGAVRVRPPWRLFDTLELVKETRPVVNTDLLAAGTAVSLAMGRLPVAALLRASSASVREEIRTKQHAARALPDGFVAEVTPGQGVASEASSEGSEAITVWEPGQPFDAAPWRESSSTLRDGDVRRVQCGACGAVAPRQAEFCPSCLASLAGAAVAVEAAASSSPDGSMAVAGHADAARSADTSASPLLDGGVGGAGHADAAQPADTGPRCPRHPMMDETRTCPRCGSFYCDGCLPESLESERTHCPDCQAREQVTDPVRLRRTLMRDMALVHCGVAVGMVIMGVLGSVGAVGKEAEALIGGACFAVFFAGVAGVLALTRSTTAGWGFFALDVLLGVAFAVMGGLLEGGILFLASVISCLQLSKARGLSRASGAV